MIKDIISENNKRMAILNDEIDRYTPLEIITNLTKIDDFAALVKSKLMTSDMNAVRAMIDDLKSLENIDLATVTFDDNFPNIRDVLTRLGYDVPSLILHLEQTLAISDKFYFYNNGQ